MFIEVIMSFLSDELLKEILPDKIDPFDETRIKHCAYEMALGNEVFISGEEHQIKKTLNKGEQIAIPPGQFALLLTDEVVKIPNNYIAFISIKFFLGKYSASLASTAALSSGYSICL